MAERPISTASESFAAINHTPLPAGDAVLDPPRAPYREQDAPASPRDSYGPSSVPSNNNSELLLPAAEKRDADGYSDEEPQPVQKKRRPLLYIVLGLAILVVVVLAVMLPVYFTVIKPNQRDSDLADDAGSTNPPEPTDAGNDIPDTPTRVTTGGDGSTITAEDGSTFTYDNKFGGYWVSDPDDPFNNNARPNSWTPPLNQSWTWGKDRVFGVNLGGLFVLEPFISPALFQKYPGSTDEWSLMTLMAADTASGGLDQLEEHYKTFITERDVAEIAGSGLNWIRLPIPYWAIETWPGEPFLAKTSWKYILRVLGWCRKYGLRVNIDLHTIPGSQNAYNHSGKGGRINFLNGVMGIANAQRALEYMRVFTEFFSQPEYKDLILMFSIVNEALLSQIGRPALTSFYLEAHNMIRGITGYGEGNGPYIGIHDGFGGLSSWAEFLRGADRIALDTHPYFAFDGSSDGSPIDTGTGRTAGGVWPGRICERWAPGINNSRSAFGVTIAGEFSNAFNDCGLFLKGVPGGRTTYPGNCAEWEDSADWSAAAKAGLQRFAEASMDALGDFFFWTWKIGNSTAGKVESPLWSYQLGLHNGWMPKDPRTAIGICASLGVARPVFDGNFQPWQTGGAGAGTFAPSATARFPWPPAEISAVNVPVSLLPTYTPTGAVQTLPPPTLSPTPTNTLNGWFNPQDTAGAPTPVAGCTYPPDPWDAVDAAVPPPCGGTARRSS